MITTVLFDLDGTLIDSQRDIACTFQAALRRLVDGSVPNEAAIARHIGKPLAQMLHDLGYSLDAAQVDAFLTTYRRLYVDQGSRYTQPYPGVTTTLGTLSSLTFGVVTTKDQRQAEHVLQQLRLAPFLRHIQGSVAGLRLKPAPDTVFAALRALRCTPQQALMVGDTTADILAGKAAGTATCAVTYGYGRREDLLQCHPDYVIDTFHDLVTVFNKLV
jgi:HAD superfamily hydrolase (TIGR01509 family)